jgi:hypothetical protein
MAGEQQVDGEFFISGEPNEALVIALALDHMAARGWIEEADDGLIAHLRRLYHANPLCQIEVKFTGEVLHDALAARPANTWPPPTSRSASKTTSATKRHG